MSVKKPMLSADQIIAHMIDKGIQFSIITEGEAKQHLDNHNNYFKLSSYRKNYTKITTGTNTGKYENLDFAHLIELARMDTEIRHLLLKMALDIEHFMKVALIKAVEDRMNNCSDEDGYEIIKGYLLADDIEPIAEKAEIMSRRNREFSKKIVQNKRNPYCKGLINRYSYEMPIWAFVELGSFGDIKDLIAYYAAKTGWTPPVDLKTLDRVRQLRNACAHGNCIINDLRPVTDTGSEKAGVSNAPRYITAFAKSAGLSKNSRQKKLSNPRINQIVNLFYTYDIVVATNQTRTQRLDELHSLINVRLKEHGDYFSKNQLLKSTYEFFQKLAAILK